MKTFKFLALAFAAMLTSVSFTACTDDENSGKDNGGGEEIADVHYDVWVSLGEGTGMGKDGTILVKNVNSLDEQTEIGFKNEGCDVTAKLYQESMIKGKYYYQIPKDKDRFGKYQISNKEVKMIAERPFAKNTYKDRRYTHAWLNDETLVVLAANGSANEVLWTKLNANTMEILNEGDLGLAQLTKIKKFSTSGLARYRKSDDKIIYAFQNKDVTTSFFVAFIDATTMKVEKIVEENRAEQMAGTAYGELLQNKMFLDDNDNLYIACNSQIPNAEKSTCQFGRLLRIKNGETDFDKNYEGYKNYTGKLVTVDYLGNNKAILYIQDPQHTGLSQNNALYTGWGDAYNSYYAILDLASDAKTEIECEGKKLPYSSGTFSQRSFVLNGKAYIGVNPEHSAPLIYVYDVRTGNTTQGATIAEGYDFNRIVYITNN